MNPDKYSPQTRFLIRAASLCAYIGIFAIVGWLSKDPSLQITSSTISPAEIHGRIAFIALLLYGFVNAYIFFKLSGMPGKIFGIVLCIVGTLFSLLGIFWTLIPNVGLG